VKRVLYVRTEGQLVQRLEDVAATARENRGTVVSRATIVRELLHAAMQDEDMLRRLGLAAED
jgi:hypothetical protein